ncbi:MAG: ComF family protein [Microscillaceae bacterium]|jgi:ComF family protein|nr:ComF family protein [Microscillaceae bacterium]
MFKDFLALIYPEFCVACEQVLTKGEDQICTDCRYHLPYTNTHLDKENILLQKFWANQPLHYALAYFYFIKNSRVQNIIHSLKYEGNQAVGELLGKWYGAILTEQGFNQTFDIILPVPLHAARLRQRGYNQSDCFARGLAEAMQIPWSAETLARGKATQTQTRKSRMERWQNVSDIFVVQKPELVDNQRVLLVDDVITTGSTVESCLQILQNNGAKELSVAAIAVARF